jgi:hypothetical protein
VRLLRLCFDAEQKLQRRELQRRNSADNESSDEDASVDVSVVGLESELMAMALNRRESWQPGDKSPDVRHACAPAFLSTCCVSACGGNPKAFPRAATFSLFPSSDPLTLRPPSLQQSAQSRSPLAGGSSSPVLQLWDLEGGLGEASDDAALVSLKDRIAARRKEGSFTETKESLQDRQSPEAATPAGGGVVGDALRERILARKQLEATGKGSDLGAKGTSVDLADAADPKDILRLRIAARRERTPTGGTPTGGIPTGGIPTGGPKGATADDAAPSASAKRSSKGSTSKGLLSGGWGVKDTRSRSPRLGMGLLSRGSVAAKTNPTPPTQRPSDNPTPPRHRPSIADRKKAEEGRKAAAESGATIGSASLVTGEVSEVALDAEGKLVKQKPSAKQLEKAERAADKEKAAGAGGATNMTPERGRGRDSEKKSTRSRQPTPGRTGWGLQLSGNRTSPAPQRPISDKERHADVAASGSSAGGEAGPSRDKSPRDRSPRAKPELKAKSQEV